MWPPQVWANCPKYLDLSLKMNWPNTINFIGHSKGGVHICIVRIGHYKQYCSPAVSAAVWFFVLIHDGSPMMVTLMGSMVPFEYMKQICKWSLLNCHFTLIPTCGWVMVIPWCVTLSGYQGWLLRYSNQFFYGDIALLYFTVFTIQEYKGGNIPSRIWSQWQDRIWSQWQDRYIWLLQYIQE